MKEKIFIIGAGRSGSSLLAAILHQAGANFNVPVLKKWDRNHGEMEHPDLMAINNWHVRQRIISQIMPSKKGAGICKRKRLNLLDRMLKKADFFKIHGWEYLVPEVFKLGYKPVIIISFRNFNDYMVSLHLKTGDDFQFLADSYFNLNTNSLLQLSLFGGCVIDYNDLIDKQEEGWAIHLSELTGINKSNLLVVRDELAASVRRRANDSLMPRDERCELVLAQLKELKGRVIKPVI
ncbi:MAG: hypothetical protein ABH822_01695 [Patescibacteria group bacterium]